MSLFAQKDIIKEMYEVVLNRKQCDKAVLYVNEQYAEQFIKQNMKLFSAFPDIRFELKEIYEEEDTVITYYTWKGTHSGEYQGISPTEKLIEVEGVSFYYFKDSKIISSKAKPDKYSFFRQLGVIQEPIKTTFDKEKVVYFLDEFEIPMDNLKPFLEKLEYNRKIIQKLNGFIKDTVLKQEIDSLLIKVFTIAEWESQEYLDEAKVKVSEEYRRIDFDPELFNKSHGITMKRSILNKYAG